jgi:2-succinyl-5-enolpyruvyl-6-hydroxy-3-cyclohexene-1-carboxylate synthase
MNNQAWADILIDELVRLGACGFVVSPGSRSTPLALAIARHPDARQALHFDERGAAFLALGWAKATGRPAVLVCTSGSAAANYWPAVVEASSGRTPLVILTADRPPELQGCGANQTIDQDRIYGGFARAAFTLPCASVNCPVDALRGTLDQVFQQAVHPPAGPVHVNCMFREPLEPGNEMPPYRFAEVGSQTTEPRTRWVLPNLEVSEPDQHWLLNRLHGVRRGLLLVGELRDAAERDAVRELAEALRWPAFPDIASGLHLGSAAPVVAHFDALLLSKKFLDRFDPDFILHVGGNFVSKRLLERVSARSCTVVQVCPHPMGLDPGRAVERRFEADIDVFCRWLAAVARHLTPQEWAIPFDALNAAAAAEIDAWCAARNASTEIGVARAVSRVVPAEATLFLANSMPVRDADMFAAYNGPGAWVEVNRGASGIDGNIATAAGLALGSEKPVVAVLGDLAALHDLNSLALLRKLKTPFVLVVVNNDGGGIFSFLPIAAHREFFESHFAAPHGLGFSQAAQMFGLPHHAPASARELTAACIEALKRPGATVIEVRTQRDRNVSEHHDLKERLAAACDRALGE